MIQQAFEVYLYISQSTLKSITLYILSPQLKQSFDHKIKHLKVILLTHIIERCKVRADICISCNSQIYCY